MKLYFKVPPEADGALLRSFLRRCSVSADLSRAVKFRGSGFFADGVPILANRRVEAGQVVSFELPPEGEGVAPQSGIPVNVVYEDAFALVLEKPPRLAVHPTLNYPLGTLANGYAAWAAQRGNSPVFRPVNRIDKDTSGLVLAAQNGYAAPLLAGRVEKLYYAVVEGELPLGPGVIDAPIGRQGGSIIGRCVTPDGKPSRTEYTILKAENGLSLAACVPVTGRTHQIRVHFASIGHPLAGDDLYGGSRARIGAVLYALGFGAEYAAVRAGRGVKHLALLGARGICRFAKDLTETAFPGAAQVVKDLFGPFVLLVKGIVALLIHAHHIHREKGLGAALKASARYFASGVRRNLRLLPRMAMYILPVCALALGSMVFEYVINQPYALAVQVNGETVGYVANEDVFDTAREDVMERISYAGSDKTELTIEPSYTIAVAHHMLDENEMADAIIQSAGDQIGEGTALYLDGELTAVCSDGDALRAYFTSRLEPYEVPDDPNVSVGFNKQVTLEDGLYFKDSLQDYADVEKALSDVKQAQ